MVSKANETSADRRRIQPRIIGPATELTEHDRYCTRCEKPLKGKVAWLELDQRDNSYHDRGDVPQDRSQGWFPFGMDCARKLLLTNSASPGHPQAAYFQEHAQ